MDQQYLVRESSGECFLLSLCKSSSRLRIFEIKPAARLNRSCIDTQLIATRREEF